MGASWRVEFLDASPFADRMVAAAADTACVLGPLVVDSPPGSYRYAVSLLDTSERVVVSTSSVLTVEEFSGFPRVYWLVGAFVLLLFLLFDYIEPPITRTYEEPAH